MGFMNVHMIIKAPIYVHFKKHYCPHCHCLLQVITESRVLYSPEDNPTSQSLRVGRGTPLYPLRLKWREFLCPQCDRQFTVDEMKDIEKNA